MQVRRRTLGLLLVVAFVGNLVVMGAGAAYSYQHTPPIPERVVGPNGETIVTEAQVQAGKIVFQRNGMMNHGSVLGNGAYFGVDFTADALALKAQFMQTYYAREAYGSAYDELSSSEQAVVDSMVTADLAESSTAGVVVYSAAEVFAHEQVRQVYVARYYEGAPERGVPAGMIETAEGARRFADFALWTALISHTERPGTTTSYTNDWPYNPLAGNTPNGATMVWSAVSVVLLVAAAGFAIWLWNAVELAEPRTQGVEIPAPEDVDLLPSQRAATRFVPLAALLFVCQVFLGAILAHYYVERDGLFGVGDALGVSIIQVIPFNLVRTYHIDLAILWIAALWLGIGLFLPGLLTGHEPDRQKTGVNALLVALAVVVVGGFTGVYLGIVGVLDGSLWWILGNEGLEYLEVGRLWKVGLLAGFGLWAVLAYRGFRPLLRREQRFGLAHMMLYAGASIALLFVAGMLYTPKTNIVMTEFWRWWVVHMWVEGAFEYFVVAVVATTLVSMGLLEKQSAEKAVMLEVLFVMGTGVIGVSHHYWWIGTPTVWLPFGTVFSTLELIPLVLILYEALGEYRALAESGESFSYTLPFAFIVASGVWNFLGAGVLGFLINIPIINYYEHGTFLTVAHAHAAMFGAFGMLALGMAIYMLRLSVDPARWNSRRLTWAFWLWNAGLTIMVVASLLPVGFLQLETSFTEGYATARSLAFYSRPLVQFFLWARVPGDLLVISGTVVFAWDVVAKRFRLRDAVEPEETDGTVVSRQVMGEDD